MHRSGWLGVVTVAATLGGAVAPQMPMVWAAVSVALASLGLWSRRASCWIVALGFLALAGQQVRPLGLVVRGPTVIHGQVVTAPIGSNAVVQVWRRGTAAGGWRDEPGRVRVQVSGRAPSLGTEVLMWGEARPLTAVMTPGAPSVALGAWWTGIRTDLAVRRWGVVDPSPRRRHPPGRHGGVLQALAWGDRQAVQPELLRLMRRTGTVHLLSISGFHVGLVAGLVGLFFAALTRAAAIWFPAGWPVRWTWLVGATAGLLYAASAGAPVGAVRASLVIGVLAVVRCVGGRPDPLSIWWVAAACVLLLDPAAAMGPSFQLSFGAVLGMVRCMPTALAWRPRWWPRWLTWAWTSASATICATLGTVPALGWWFQEVASAPVWANLVAVPVVSLVLVPLAAVHAVGPAAADPWVGSVNDAVVDALMVGLRWGELPPLVCALTTSGAVALWAALAVHRRWAWALAIVVATAPGVAPPSSGVRVTFPDVGQGSSALVEWPDGRRWLVDGGGFRSGVLNWLRRRGVRRLDVVVASQGLDDHAAGLVPVVRALPVAQVWLPPNSRHDPQLIPLVQAALERGVPVIPGPEESVASVARRSLRSERDRGIALVVGDVSGSILLPADLGPSGMDALAPALPRSVAAAVMPQHGGRSGASLGWLGSQAPPVVVVQSGRWSRYRSPHPIVERAWRSQGSRVYRTDLHGTVELSLAHGQVGVRTWHWQRGWTARTHWPVPLAPWRSAASYVDVTTSSTSSTASSSAVSSSSSSSSTSSSSAEPLRSSMKR